MKNIYIAFIAITCIFLFGMSQPGLWKTDSGYLLSLDMLEISKGNVPGHSIEIKFGSNSAVGTSNEVLWDGGASYNWLSSAQTLNLSSSSTADDGAPAGTGALTLTIYGLDANYALQSETKTLDGTTIVTTDNTYISVYRLMVATEGSGADANVGDLYAFTGTETDGVPNDSTKIYAKISATNGQTLMTPYTVPDGVSAYLVSGWATSGAGKNVNIQFFARPFAGAKNIKFNFDILNNTFTRDYIIYGSFAEKTQLWVEASVDTGTTTVSAGYTLLLIEN